MSNVRELPASNVSFDRASEWLAKLDRGLTTREEQELRLWLRERRENYEAMAAMARLWDRLDALSRLAEICPDASRSRMASRRYAWAMAAGVVLMLALTAWIVRSTVTPEQTASPRVAQTPVVYETALGAQASYVLEDGTRVVLNTNSRLSVVYTTTNRFLHLERGEIHVNAAHDRSRPLSVIAEGRVVQAVGTEFNVEITPDKNIELVVTEGVVMVGILDRPVDEAASKGPIVLEPSSALVVAGQEAVIDSKADPEKAVRTAPIEKEEIAVKLSWREGNLIFRGESLEEAVAEIGRYTAVEFVFLDEDSRKVRVAGLFKAGDVEGLLKALRENFHISYERVGDKIVLSSP